MHSPLVSTISRGQHGDQSGFQFFFTFMVQKKGKTNTRVIKVPQQAPTTPVICMCVSGEVLENTVPGMRWGEPVWGAGPYHVTYRFIFSSSKLQCDNLEDDIVKSKTVKENEILDKRTRIIIYITVFLLLLLFMP